MKPQCVYEKQWKPPPHSGIAQVCANSYSYYYCRDTTWSSGATSSPNRASPRQEVASRGVGTYWYINTIWLFFFKSISLFGILEWNVFCDRLLGHANVLLVMYYMGDLLLVKVILI